METVPKHPVNKNDLRLSSSVRIPLTLHPFQLFYITLNAPNIVFMREFCGKGQTKVLELLANWHFHLIE